MKKSIFFFVTLLSMHRAYSHKQEVIGRSFILTRPGYHHLSTHNQLWHEIIYNKKGPCFCAVQLTPFFQTSHPKAKTNHYFLINAKETLLVAGDNTPINTVKVRDVRAEWIGLDSDTNGTFSLRPQQKQYGVVVEYNQDLKNIVTLPFIQDWQVNITIPFIMVHNTLQPCQKNITNTNRHNNTSDNTIVQAFDQPNWCYDKIYSGTKSRTGIAEIKICLESAYLAKNHFLISYHSGLIIPAAKKQNDEYLFNPFLGYNRHVGIVGGVDFQLLLNRDPSQMAFCFFMSLESTFLIRNKQKRTFDLKNKPWSRFLLYNHIDGQPNQTIPGVNILTRKCTVRPHNVVEFTTGWRFEQKHITFEFGYNIWGHDTEHIERLSKPFPSVYGIAAVQPVTDSNTATASTSTIAQQGPTDISLVTNNPLFIPITQGDLDFNSPAAGSALNHKVHFAIGIKNKSFADSFFIGFGGFVDIPQKNGALKTGGFWTKIGSAF